VTVPEYVSSAARRTAWAQIDLEAVRHNAALLAARVAPASARW
jgi:alanine racemase